MSHSRHSKVSAYQVYSSKTSSSRRNDTAERKKGKDRRYKKDSETDSDDDVLKPIKHQKGRDNYSPEPEKLSRRSNDYSPDPEKHSRRSNGYSPELENHSHRSKSRRHSKEEKHYESSSSSDESDDSRRQGSWDNTPTKKRYSDSDNEEIEDSRDDANRDKRSWRESSRHSSSVKPLVVDMSKSRHTREKGSRSRSNQPKSLVDDFFPAPQSLLGKGPAELMLRPNNKYTSSDRYKNYDDRLDDRSSYSSSKLSYTNDRQSYTSDRANYSNERSYNERSNYTSDQSSSRSSYSNERSSYSSNRPSYSNERSSYNNARSSFSERSSFPNDRVSYSASNRLGFNKPFEVDRVSYSSKNQDWDANKRRNNDDKDWETSNKRRKVDDENPKIVLPKICQFGDTAQSVLVLPEHCASVGLHGRATITLLLGQADLLGHTMQPHTPYPVYSPLTGGLLALRCSSELLSEEDVKTELLKHGCSGADIDARLSAKPGISRGVVCQALGACAVAVLLVQRLDSAMCDFISSLSPFTMIFQLGSSTWREARDKQDHSHGAPFGIQLHKVGLRVAPLKEHAAPCVTLDPEYQAMLDTWCGRVAQALTDDTEADSKPPSILTCGAKNTGKSTFNRVLINTALKSASAVVYLDCDVGQTEFSPPGTLSLHIITEPVLAPPFCHQRQAESMVYFGDTSPASDPALYLRCLAHLLKAYKEIAGPAPLPLIINTLGWVEGIGLMLLLDIVTCTEPDLVVQLEGLNQSANPPAITHETVALQPGWMYNLDPIEDPKAKMSATHEHELFLLMTRCNPRKDVGVKLQPVDLRNLNILSSLCLGLEKGETLNSLRPYCVPMSSLAVCVCHQRVVPGELLEALDTSLVALCVSDTSQLTRDDASKLKIFRDMPVCECLGLGMVRGIDAARGLLYLVTSLPIAQLRKVNTLMKGTIGIPEQLLIKQTNNCGLPYVDALVPATGMTGLRQRARLPRTYNQLSQDTQDE